MKLDLGQDREQGSHGLTLFVATIGGHLTELSRIADIVSIGDDAVWVTNPSPQSSSLLDGKDVEYVPYVGVRSVAGVLRCIPYVRQLMQRRKISYAISTGSAIALGYLPYLAMRGVECHYVESVTRVTGPSLTGRILRYCPGVKTYSQYQGWAEAGWRFGGNLLDSYRRVPADRSGSTNTIRVVVTVGIATGYPFRRLLEHLVPLLGPDGALAATTGVEVETTWLTGGTSVEGLPIQVTPPLGASELAATLSRADIVISHAGAGSILDALDAGALPIVVPRDGQSEQVDDHQEQLASEVSRRGLALKRTAANISLQDLLAAFGYRVVRSELVEVEPAGPGGCRAEL